MTDPTLKEYLESLVRQERELREANRKGHLDVHEMLATALLKADEDLERRLENMNQFRQQINAERGTFLTRERFESWESEHAKWGNSQVGGNEDRFRKLEDRQAEERGARARQATIFGVVMAVGLALFKFIPQGFGIQ